MAFLAFREDYTFSDKAAPADWPSFCRGILDSQADTMGCDKMMLGTQDNISGFSQRSGFSIRSGFASKKGLRPAIQQAAAAPPKSAPQDVLTTYGDAPAPTAHVVTL